MPHSRRYSDLKQALVPVEAVKDIPRLAVPLDPEAWLADRKARMTDDLARLAKAARAGAIPGGSIENGILKLDRLSAAVLDLYDRLPAIGTKPIHSVNYLATLKVEVGCYAMMQPALWASVGYSA